MDNFSDFKSTTSDSEDSEEDPHSAVAHGLQNVIELIKLNAGLGEDQYLTMDDMETGVGDFEFPEYQHHAEAQRICESKTPVQTFTENTGMRMTRSKDRELSQESQRQSQTQKVSASKKEQTKINVQQKHKESATRVVPKPCPARFKIKIFKIEPQDDENEPRPTPKATVMDQQLVRTRGPQDEKESTPKSKAKVMDQQPVRTREPQDEKESPPRPKSKAKVMDQQPVRTQSPRRASTSRTGHPSKVAMKVEPSDDKLPPPTGDDDSGMKLKYTTESENDPKIVDSKYPKRKTIIMEDGRNPKRRCFQILRVKVPKPRKPLGTMIMADGERVDVYQSCFDIELDEPEPEDRTRPSDAEMWSRHTKIIKKRFPELTEKLFKF